MATSGKPHVLIVNEFDRDDPDASFELQHHGDCPTEQRHFGGDIYYTEHACHVGAIVSFAGLDMSFMHRDDPRYDWGCVRLEPGQYLIEAYEEHYPATPDRFIDEYDEGLRLVENAEVPA